MKILITGGSEGIGYAFAKYYASKKHILYLVARNMMQLVDVKEELENTFGIKVYVFAIDLSDVDACRKLYEQVEKEQIDILINNAGVGYLGESWKIDIAKEEKMVQLNCIALMNLTKLFAKDMVQNKSGTIINISSTGSFEPGPYIAGYYATKAFVSSYTQAIAKEVKPFGVQVYCVAPGPTYTKFYEKSGTKPPRNAMHVDKVVQYTISHMKGNCMIIPGWLNRLVLLMPVSLRTYFVQVTKKRKLGN